MTVLTASASLWPLLHTQLCTAVLSPAISHTMQKCAAAPYLDVLRTRSLQPLLLGLPAGNIAYC